MSFSDESYDLRIELDQKGCELQPAQIEKMESMLDTLRKITEPFPVANLYIDVIFHHSSQDYHVKTSLALPGKTLFTGERGDDALTAFESCVRKLVHKVTAFKARMAHKAESAKQAAGTHPIVEPSAEFDLAAIETAVEEGEYEKFRDLLDVFDSTMRQRIRQWLDRYPELEQRLHGDLQIDDLLEEVFLNAFERFAHRSHQVSPGDWLEQLIAPSIHAILSSPDEEIENIRFVRSSREIHQNQGGQS